SETGNLYGRILQNPGKLGQWLSDKGAISFSVEKGSKRHLFSDFKRKDVRRYFPFVKNSYTGSPIISAKIDIETFCPLGINDLETSSLPVLLLEMTCSNPTLRNEAFSLRIKPDSSLVQDIQLCRAPNYSGITNNRFQITCNSDVQWESGELIVPISLKAGEQKVIRILSAFYDKDWISANRFQNIEEITDYAHKTWSVLKEKTVLFGDAIPKTGDKELDNYLRWYMIPGISLTKCTKDNNVLTMGYCELNQRDSYWTSWLHLVLFKNVERKMIEESIACQQPSGKIPTTILPLIERNDDLDINAFFILRVARFYQFYHDKEGLSTYWEALKKAMDWLLSRDFAGDGLPVQISFWGDWKDVRGIEGRKYSPFSGLIYLAALKQMIFLSREHNDSESLKKYESAYQKGYAFINKPIAEGGLWNGDFYCQKWKDGQVNDKLLQDQTIGILFDVVPEDKALKIIHSLNTRSMTPYGICETFPYYPASFGYQPATYHNGAVWPWLSFMDCWARIRIGKEKESIELIKKVANADLVASGDWSPNEHINSLTGENLGFQLQGWNAGLFGLVYFGIVHPGIIP
ncbi:MAG: glycoside hydrolase family 116 protein, partial [Mediterranea sp.]|nr:glycoside hydrolase family 116 protein [Mediterranea sp.]